MQVIHVFFFFKYDHSLHDEMMMSWFFNSLLFRSPIMSAVFKRIYTLERSNCDSSVFDSLYLKSFLCHGRVSVLINPVNPEKQIKDGYHHQQLICCLSKCSVSQLEVKVSIKNDI